MEFIAKKIKILDNGIEIKYDKINPNAPNIVMAEMSIKTSHLSSKNVMNAVFDLTPHFRKIIEDSDTEQHYMIKEVTIKDNERKGMGVQLTGERRLLIHPDPVVIKTPVLWEDSNDKRENLSADLLQLVKEAQYEADEFITKERNQQIEIFAEVADAS